MQEALRAWGEATLSLALDTTMRWGQYCMLQRGQLTGNARFVNEVKAILGRHIEHCQPERPRQEPEK